METSPSPSRIQQCTGMSTPMAFCLPPHSSQVKASAPSKVSSSMSANYETLKDKRAWDFAIAPAKSLPMQAFMLYMSGGGVQIFSMGIVFMLLLSPFKNLAAINTGMLQCIF